MLFATQRGSGVAKDANTAFNFYLSAADAGNPVAQYCLGECLLSGSGVATDVESAVKWFNAAAVQNNADACLRLFVCYSNGVGVPVDQPVAKDYLRRAALQGHPSRLAVCGNVLIGLCFRRGRIRDVSIPARRRCPCCPNLASQICGARIQEGAARAASCGRFLMTPIGARCRVQLQCY